MGFKRSLLCLTCSWLLNLVNSVGGSSVVDTSEDLGGISTITSITVACLSVLIIVFVISLCGGCTPMEVGSEDHAASGNVKHGGNYGNYDSVATDANTRVLTAGTSLPNDPYQHQDHALPYDLHPAGSNTATSFAGYAPVQQPGGYGQAQQTGPAGYGQAQQAGGAAGYGQAQSGGQPGYGQAASAGQQRNFQGGHRPAFDSEPPPPAYEEATRPTAPAQSYGW